MSDGEESLEIGNIVLFNDTATPEICTLSLHDALQICLSWPRTSCDIPLLEQSRRGKPLSIRRVRNWKEARLGSGETWLPVLADRKSTRLNSSHAHTSYAPFCLKKNTQSYFCRVSLLSP